MSVSLKDLRQEVGYILDECFVGTIASPTTSSFIDEALIDWHGSGDTKLTGAWVKITSGGQAGTIRRVGSYDDSTGQVTLSRSWTAPSAGDEVEIHLQLSPDEIDRCINRAIEQCYYIAQEEIVPKSDQRQYPLTYSWLSHPTQIRAVYWRVGDPYERRFYPVRWYTTQEDTGEFVLLIRPYAASVSNMLILEVMRPYSTLSSDASTTTCPKDWLRAAVEVEVYRFLARHDPGQDATRLKQMQAEAVGRFQERCRIYQPRPRPRVQLPDTARMNTSSDVVR